MVHPKEDYKYDAYDAYNGTFPANFVICVYKGFGFTKHVFNKVRAEREAVRKRDIINKFKWNKS